MSWEPGRWTLRTFFFRVPPRTPAGEYTLTLALYDSRARQRLPLSTAGLGRDEAPVSKIRVR